MAVMLRMCRDEGRRMTWLEWSKMYASSVSFRTGRTVRGRRVSSFDGGEDGLSV